LVRNLSQIDGLDPNVQAIRIAHGVGGKKRREIMTRAKEKSLHVFNPHELKLAKEEVERAEKTKEGETEKKEATEEAGTQNPTVNKKEAQDKEPR